MGITHNKIGVKINRVEHIFYLTQIMDIEAIVIDYLVGDQAFWKRVFQQVMVQIVFDIEEEEWLTQLCRDFRCAFRPSDAIKLLNTAERSRTLLVLQSSFEKCLL